VRVHDSIRVNPLVIEGHVLLIHNQSANTLLSVPGRKLVTQLWPSRLPNEDLDEHLFVVRVTDQNFVDVSGDWGLVSKGRVSVGHRSGLAGEGVVRRVGWRLFIDVDVAWVNALADTSETVQLDDVVLFRDVAILVQRCISQTVESIVKTLSHE
jgi:hypothetical protein